MNLHISVHTLGVNTTLHAGLRELQTPLDMQKKVSGALLQRSHAAGHYASGCFVEGQSVSHRQSSPTFLGHDKQMSETAAALCCLLAAQT